MAGHMEFFKLCSWDELEFSLATKQIVFFLRKSKLYIIFIQCLMLNKFMNFPEKYFSKTTIVWLHPRARHLK